MSIHSIRPEDVLPDGAERASFDGLEIRKGTVAAFVANARALDDAEQAPRPTENCWQRWGISRRSWRQSDCSRYSSRGIHRSQSW
ncbi:hypothetical protein [Rhodococcus sp. BS-15]|uniref:hypothetical protein n=1 Tax=Rhodococcus sp. BS-15 TaxID=1304954 RepID=UPI000B167B4C|nr:hypothetical protein [Rhodococcus sp. BS-15]